MKSNESHRTQRWKDDDMPLDEQGIRADIIMDPVSIMNRMNPSQSYEQYLNRGAEIIRQRIKNLPVNEAYTTIIEYISDINPKWGQLVDSIHNSPMKQQELVNESIKEGIQIQINPTQENINTQFIIDLEKKWNIDKSRVTYGVPQADGTIKKVTTKQPIMIGPMYVFKLYKMPHLSACGFGFVNQYHSPVRPSPLGKLADYYSRTTIRMGEDEIRYMVLAAGSSVAARILGMYANSPQAVSELAWHLMDSPKPMELKHIEMNTENVVKTNVINGVTKHIFATVGINITPPIQKKETKLDREIAHLDLPVEVTNEEYK